MMNGSPVGSPKLPGLRQLAISTPFSIRVARLQSWARGRQYRREPLTEIQ